MSNSSEKTAREAQKKRELKSYVIGLLLCALLTLLAFGVVIGGVSAPAVGWILAIAALAQLIVQLRYFLHVNAKQTRDDLQLILFSTLIMVILMVGSVWIMGSLASRMWSGM